MGRGSGEGQRKSQVRRGPKGPFKWTGERIERELRKFLSSRSEPSWPTREEFRASSRTDLWRALQRSGGSRAWASRLGYELRPDQAIASLPEAKARGEAQQVMCLVQGPLPNAHRIRALGFPLLASLVQRQGGARQFSRRYRLNWPL